MPPELVVQLDEAVELVPHLRDALLQLPRPLLHREAADRERDHLQVGEERVGRGRDHVPLRGVRADVHVGVGILADELVVDALRRHV